MKRLSATLLGLIQLGGCQSQKPPRIPATDHFPAEAAVVQLSVNDSRTGVRDMKGSAATIQKFLEPALADVRIGHEANAPLSLAVDVIDYDLLPPSPGHAQLTVRVTVRKDHSAAFDRVFQQMTDLPKDSLGSDANKARAMAFDTAAEKLALQIASNEELQKAVGKAHIAP